MYGTGVIPHSGANISPNKPEHVASRQKVATSRIIPSPKFIPSGSGRDLFQQVSPDPIIAHTGKQFSTRSPSYKSVSPSSSARPSSPGSNYMPSGSGRDLYMVRGFRGTYTAAYGRTMRVNSYEKIPRPRTSPPPRYQSKGHGRDSFRNPNLSYVVENSNNKLYGFNYGSESISQSAKYVFNPEKYTRNETAFIKSQKASVTRLSRPSSAPPTRTSNNDAKKTISPENVKHKWI
jgi:hypothetical protein